MDEAHPFATFPRGSFTKSWSVPLLPCRISNYTACEDFANPDACFVRVGERRSERLLGRTPTHSHTLYTTTTLPIRWLHPKLQVHYKNYATKLSELQFTSDRPGESFNLSTYILFCPQLPLGVEKMVSLRLALAGLVVVLWFGESAARGGRPDPPPPRKKPGKPKLFIYFIYLLIFEGFPNRALVYPDRGGLLSVVFVFEKWEKLAKYKPFWRIRGDRLIKKKKKFFCSVINRCHNDLDCPSEGGHFSRWSSRYFRQVDLYTRSWSFFKRLCSSRIAQWHYLPFFEVVFCLMIDLGRETGGSNISLGFRFCLVLKSLQLVRNEHCSLNNCGHPLSFLLKNLTFCHSASSEYCQEQGSPPPPPPCVLRNILKKPNGKTSDLKKKKKKKKKKTV